MQSCVVECGMQVTNSSAFVGSVPDNYDQHLGPMFFRPYALDIAERVAKHNPSSILETAAGTGVSTEAIRQANLNASITATDLNPGMLERADAVRPGLNVLWAPADAMGLPYEDAQFDMLVTQYGVMFYPDKPMAFREAFRVLKPGGIYLFNIWDGLDANDVGRAVGETLQRLIPENTPMFLQTPWGWSDPTPILEAGKAAGFETPAPETVALACNAVSADSAARGLILGSPLYGQIVEREVDTEPIVEEATRILGERYGAAPMACKMSAKVYEFKKSL